MPNTREKLIDLLYDQDTYLCDRCGSRSVLDVCEQIADHLIANGVMVQQWIPVTERLPEKHGIYLALTPSNLVGKEYHEWLIYYHPKGGFHDTDTQWGDIPMDDVTHWMPLPTPPKGE